MNHYSKYFGVTYLELEFSLFFTLHASRVLTPVLMLANPTLRGAALASLVQVTDKAKEDATELLAQTELVRAAGDDNVRKC